MMPFSVTQNWWKEKKPTTDLVSFTRSGKSIFFQPIFHFTILNAFILEFGACLAENNLAQEQP